MIDEYIDSDYDEVTDDSSFICFGMYLFSVLLLITLTSYLYSSKLKLHSSNMRKLNYVHALEKCEEGLPSANSTIVRTSTKGCKSSDSLLVRVKIV